MPSVFNSFLFVCFIFLSSILHANGIEKADANHTLKLNKDGIKVYTFNRRDSKFATFKAVTYIYASLDSILAVFFDNESSPEWVHACTKSFMLEDISFNERYHYQSFNIPFPFKNRDFIFHSIMKQDPDSKMITISMSSAAEYCSGNSSSPCKIVNQSDLVRVKKSVATYTLEPDKKGTKITWVQHTEPGGNLPGWLVNQLVQDIPYWTFKQLAEKVKEDKYKNARLFYDQELAIKFNTPTKRQKNDFPVYPTF